MQHSTNLKIENYGIPQSGILEYLIVLPLSICLHSSINKRQYNQQTHPSRKIISNSLTLNRESKPQLYLVVRLIR